MQTYYETLEMKLLRIITDSRNVGCSSVRDNLEGSCIRRTKGHNSLLTYHNQCPVSSFCIYLLAYILHTTLHSRDIPGHNPHTVLMLYSISPHVKAMRQIKFKKITSKYGLVLGNLPENQKSSYCSTVSEDDKDGEYTIKTRWPKKFVTHLHHLNVNHVLDVPDDIEGTDSEEGDDSDEEGNGASVDDEVVLESDDDGNDEDSVLDEYGNSFRGDDQEEVLTDDEAGEDGDSDGDDDSDDGSDSGEDEDEETDNDLGPEDGEDDDAGGPDSDSDTDPEFSATIRSRIK
ncbi:hypothetical protein EDB19DRAFT_2027252 [Suillus lakei]|nr:hypothetical protein EDB19DRAFT_2027252 [Suillus lakei]